MNVKETKLEDVLKSRGIDMKDVDNVSEADIPKAKESTQKLMDIYYTLKVTADMEAAYWYNRTWWENDGEVIEVEELKL